MLTFLTNVRRPLSEFVIYLYQTIYTLRVESFAGRNFGGDKLSRMAMVETKFRGYELL